jgi:hypothetical protein
MAIKVVILFQQITDVQATIINPVISAPSIGYGSRSHLGGWSESLIWDANTLSPLLNALRIGYGGKPALLPARAALLGKGADIVGVRFYQGGTGKGQSLALQYPGAAGVETDVPQMALLIKAAPASAVVTRRFTLRGIPDGVIQVGEFNPPTWFVTAVANYFDALGNFSFSAVDPGQTTYPIVSVNGAGEVRINGPFPPFTVNQVVYIQKTIDANGIARSAKLPIGSVDPTNNKFTVIGWTFSVCTGGIATAKSKANFQINSANCAVSRVVVRKVGRPFEQYHGRRSKRRRSA